MNNTDIDWCDKTLNPIVGCPRGCAYCYARKKNQQFKFITDFSKPQFFPERLKQLNTRKGYTIFMDSMSDIGFWEDEWRRKVFGACKKYPQHKYLFLTKSPERYEDEDFQEEIILHSMLGTSYFGITATNQIMLDRAIEAFGNMQNRIKTFISIEPMHESMEIAAKGIRGFSPWFKWVIIGAETGNRKGKIIPKRDWIESIVDQCKIENVPVFLKGSLKDIWRDNLIQQYPW